MPNLIEIAIPVEEKVAAKLRDPEQREAIGRMLSRMLEPDANVDRLMAAIERLKSDAQARGLTDALLDEELDAYNAERRS
jgi:hypothetical protein